jgi:hypothetical protein
MPLNSTRGAASAKGFGLLSGGKSFIVATGGTITFSGDFTQFILLQVLIIL